MNLTRRQLIRALGGAAIALRYGTGCGGSSPSGDAVFAADELEVLRAFADVIIPEDDEPGGAKLGAVEYIEVLLGAFDAATPPIYAGGPFSGRNPFADGTLPANDFVNFIELDRVKLAAWRLRVLGSDAVGGAPNQALYGAVVALEARIKTGLRAAIDAATKPVSEMSADERATLFDGQDPDFKDLMIELVTEAAFAAPEYGGNIDLAGWKLCHFEGDSLPAGYSQLVGGSYVERADAPLSGPNPSEPEPLGADVEQLIELVITVLGGRVTP